MNIIHPPFSCIHSPQIPELLYKLNCSIALTTYQASKVILISPKDMDSLIQLPRNFENAMGMAVTDNRIAIASKYEVSVLANSSSTAIAYPPNPGKYDSLYLPRATYYTGELDLHDMAWGEKGLCAVNTRFSCLSAINDQHSFEPIWQPSFITDLVPEDRCHLNGLAMKNGNPEYVSALGRSNIKEGWREGKINGGIIIHVPSGEIVLNGLAMPHSPRIFDEKLYALLSATGELICADPETGKYEVINKLKGFVRGMAKHGDYLFVGLSRLRQSSSSFRDLPIAQNSVFAGIVVIYLPTGSIAGYIKYESSVEEIYDVQILPQTKRPGLLSSAKPEHKNAIILPDNSFWIVKSEGKVTNEIES